MYIYVCTCIYIHIDKYTIRIYTNTHCTYLYAIFAPAPMNHVKIFKGWPPRDSPSKLVQLRYKIFPLDQRGLVEMKNPTRLSNKTTAA